MQYKFLCPSCGKQVIVSMQISSYTAAGHYCECGAELVRDVKDFCTVSQRNVDGFYGVEKENKKK